MHFSPSVCFTALLVYRVFRNEPKRNVKLLHGIIHLLALIMSIIGEKESANKEVNTTVRRLSLRVTRVFVCRFCCGVWLPQNSNDSRHVLFTQLVWHGNLSPLLLTGMHTPSLQSHFRSNMDTNSSLFVPTFLLVGYGFAVLPVSRCVVMVTSLIPPHPCILWPDSAGYGHRQLSAGHHRETALQHHVRVPLSICSSISTTSKQIRLCFLKKNLIVHMVRSLLLWSSGSR